MAFFAGLAEGFITGRKMKAEKEETDRLADYRKTEQKYRADRDAILDDRYIEEREAARKREAILDDRWGAEFDLQKDEAGRAASQWDATFAYRQDRDAIGDQQWLAQQDTIAAEAVESRRRFEKQFDFTSQESDKAAERWKDRFGFDQDRALKADEWQAAMQEYRETRDSVSDEQWSSTFDYNKDQAAVAEERWKTEHGFRKEQALTAEQRWEAEMDWRSERAEVADQQFDTQLADKRMTTLISAGLAPGGTSTKGSKKGNTSTDIADSVIALRSRISSAELDDDDKKYFDVILKDPGAAHRIYSFMQEQASEGNVIDISDIPSLIQIAGVSEGKSEEAMALLKSNGVDVKDQDAFFGALQTLKEYSPTTVVTDISAEAYRNPNDIKVIKDQRDLFIDTAIPAAQAILANLPKGDPVRGQLSQALANVGSGDKAIKSRAISTIMQHVVKPDYITRLEKRGGAFKNLSQNEFLLPYMQGEEEEAVEATAVPEGGVLPEDNAPIAPSTSRTALDDAEPAGDVPSFDSAEEYNAWRSEGNSGPVIVMGQRGVAQPIETVEEPAAEPEVTPTVLDDAPASAEPEVQGLVELAKEQGIRSKAALNKFIFQNVEPVQGDRKATNALQRQMFEELSAILGL